jgi:hypothetical protein
MSFRYDSGVQPFNPLNYRSCLTAVSPPPTASAWQEHIPFGMLLVELLRPRVFVELGVHTGASYLAFCQAVANLGVSCTCYGVDTFEGDEHAGRYERHIEAQLRERHDPVYGGFSRLITSTFDEAARYIPDGSVDLLHIDGMHSYEAVAHDFATWSPKLSTRAVVLFHDINVRERGFGVWRFWEEQRARFPHLAFSHGHGLGVLAVGPEQPPAFEELLRLDGEAAERFCALFFLLGHRITLQVELAGCKRALQAGETSRQAAAAQSAATINRLQQQLAEAEAEKEALRCQIGALQQTVDQLNTSVSFRLGMGATAPLRWLSKKIEPSGS